MKPRHRNRVSGVAFRGERKAPSAKTGSRPRITLVDFLRQRLGLTGSHVGCEGRGVCGACHVPSDGQVAARLPPARGAGGTGRPRCRPSKASSSGEKFATWAGKRSYGRNAMQWAFCTAGDGDDRGGYSWPGREVPFFGARPSEMRCRHLFAAAPVNSGPSWTRSKKSRAPARGIARMTESQRNHVEK